MTKDLWAGKEPGDYSGLVSEAGPCRLGGLHTEPRPNGMVYCEHGISVYHCYPCRECTDSAWEELSKENDQLKEELKNRLTQVIRCCNTIIDDMGTAEPIEAQKFYVQELKEEMEEIMVRYHLQPVPRNDKT